jgi:XisH protein
VWYRRRSVPSRDVLHHAVRNALVRDGWTITDDPLHLKVPGLPGRNLFVDLGAQRLLAAERGAVTIAVEVKSFLGASEVRDLENALGQFMLYQTLLRRFDPHRPLFLAIPEDAWKTIFAEALGQIVVTDLSVRLLIVNPEQEVVIQWFPSTPGETPSSAS